MATKKMELQVGQYVVNQKNLIYYSFLDSLKLRFISDAKNEISSPLFKNVNAYLLLYLVDGEYGFLDLILFIVNHFRLLNHADPSSPMAGTLMNHACNRVLTKKGKHLTLNNFLLCHLTKHVTA